MWSAAQAGLAWKCRPQSPPSEIGEKAFYQCSSLASVTFRCGASPLTIDGSAFDNSAPPSVALPSTATSSGSVSVSTLAASSVCTDMLVVRVCVQQSGAVLRRGERSV